MTSAQWDRVKAITADALDLPVLDAYPFVLQASKDDSQEVRDEVVRLLACAAMSDHSILSEPPWIGQEPFHNDFDANLASREPLVFPDRFSVVRELGRGSMGLVFEAIDLERKLVVALKAMPVVSATRWNSVKQEFRALAGLSHPNLVCLYDFIRSDKCCFLSMELIRGNHFPRGEQRCDYERLHRLIVQAVAGISAIHTGGRLHGDLKPANVLVTDADRVVIVDFGLAAEIRGRQGPGRYAVVGGTPRYMAPEMLEGGAAECSDWFALGRMVADAVEHAASDVPKYVNHLCDRLLDPNPDRRAGHQEISEILAGTTSVSRIHAARPLQRIELIGRARELALIDQAYRRSRSNTHAGAVAVLVSGASGYGKSLLIDRFLERLTASSDDVVTFRSRCYRQESGPYKALDDIVVELCRYVSSLPADQAEDILPKGGRALAALFPGLQPPAAGASEPPEPESCSDPTESRRRAFRLIRRSFEKASKRFPMVLWLDDLQWMDHESADVLADVLAEPNLRILLICSFRRSGTSKEPQPLQKLLNLPAVLSDSTVDIRLDQLAASEAVSLAMQVLPHGSVPNPGEFAKQIARESGGVPFLVLELARSAEFSGSLSIEELVGNRMALLDGDTRKFLMASAIAGRPIPQEFAFSAAGLDRLEPTVLIQLSFAGLLRVDGSQATDTVEPSHDRIRQAICSRIVPEEAVEIHRKLAIAMEHSSRGDAETTAVHFEACGEMDRAGRHYASAGDRASRAFAFHRAGRLFQKAIELCRSAPEERAALEIKAAEAFSNDGRSREASDYYRAAAAKSPPARAGYLDALSAYHLCITGDIDEGRSRFQDLLRKIPKRIHGRRELALGAIAIQNLVLHFAKLPQAKASTAEELSNVDVVWLAAAGVGTSDLLGGFELMTYNCLQALRAGEPTRVIRALAFHAAFASMAGGAQSGLAIKHLALCEGLSRQLGDPPHARAVLMLTKAIRSYNLGFWTEALEQYESAERVLIEECRGLNWELAFARAGKMWSLVSCGAVQRLHEEAVEIIATAQSRGDLATAVNVGSMPLPYALIVLRDEPALARDTANHWLKRWTKAGYGLQHACHFLLTAWSFLYEERIEDAFQLLQTEWGAVRKSGILGLPSSAALFWETRARIMIALAARRQGFVRLKLLYGAKSIARRLDRGTAIHASAYSGQVRAALQAANGDRMGAAVFLERSLEDFRRCGMALNILAVLHQLETYPGNNPPGQYADEAGMIIDRQKVANPKAVFRMHGSIPAVKN